MLSRSIIHCLLTAGLLLRAQTGLSQVESDAYGVMLGALLILFGLLKLAEHVVRAARNKEAQEAQGGGA